MKISGILSRFVVAGAALAFSTGLVSAAPTAGKAEVTAIKGTVTIGNQPAKVGDQVGIGTQIVTGAGSSAELDLGQNGPSLQIQQGATVILDELSFDDAGPEVVVNTKINLQAGKVAGYVKKTSSQSTYTVVTPTTTAAIRGTTYMVSAEGDVYVWDGCVDVQSGGVRYNVCAGQHFDPRIPGVVPNPLPTPLPPRVQPPVSPVGPIINLSPVKPEGGAPVVVQPGS